MQEQKIRQLGITDLMDEALISEWVGLRKPDRRIFERALERLRVLPAEACYVGDRPLAVNSFEFWLGSKSRQTYDPSP